VARYSKTRVRCVADRAGEATPPVPAGPSLDAVFVAVSTGGTAAGIARRLREEAASAAVVGVDVNGSVAFGDRP